MASIQSDGAGGEDGERLLARRIEELERENAALRAAEAARDAFVADLRHDLGAPLTNIKLYADLLTRGRPERRDHYLAVLASEIARMQRLLDNLSAPSPGSTAGS